MLEELGDRESDNEAVLLTGDCDRLRLKGLSRSAGHANDAGSEDHQQRKVK
jgi:hypothetical protein